VQTVTELRPTAASALGETASTPAAVRQVAHVYREFLMELRREVRCGVMRPLVDGDEDAAGVDFAFAVEVKPDDFEMAVAVSSRLEAKYFAEHGVNFLVVPEAM
jgi:hypothetical protein